MSYQIIPITEDYIALFWDALDSVAREGKYLAFLYAPPIKETQTYVLENIQDQWPHFIALSDNKVIGWCDITTLHRHIFAHSGILGLGVVAGYRGQGVGKALLRTAIEAAWDKGLLRIELNVREPNKPALALYEKIGFVVEGVKRKAVKIGDYYEDLIYMGLLKEEYFK